MLFKHIPFIDPAGQVQAPADVAVRGDTIVFIGAEAPAGDWGEVYDGRDRLLIPGLYNIHAHTPMTLLRGYGENLALQDWLSQRMFPFEAQLTPEDVYYGYLLGVAEMTRYGVVASTDMYFFGDSMARAALDSGFKTNFCLSPICADERSYQELPVYQENQAMFSQYHLAGDGRLRLDLSLHAEYTSTPKIAAAVAEHCQSLGLRMHLHLSETQLEHEGCKQRRGGKTPAQYFRDLGVFDQPTTAAHCVWVEDGDLDILAEKGVTIAANPISNLKLASGICPVPKAMARGINIGLGTDSVASNNNLNLFEEMKLHAILHKATAGDPTLITPAEAFACATANGARSQGRLDCQGIKEGSKADLAVLDIAGPNARPCHNLLYNLVYAADGGDVRLTMVDGRVLYRDGTWPTLDMEKIYWQVERSCQRILAALAK
ncbi:MAG: amidohydrolase [Peptococcaceae bacterium]|jgi:5-methylthioadenosine/S-adenosylhomocysteine deaminase|nr:amidohydrolase [Peptococcaceae bacterium]